MYWIPQIPIAVTTFKLITPKPITVNFQADNLLNSSALANKDSASWRPPAKKLKMLEDLHQPPPYKSLSQEQF